MCKCSKATFYWLHSPHKQTLPSNSLVAWLCFLVFQLLHLLSSTYQIIISPNFELGGVAKQLGCATADAVWHHGIISFTDWSHDFDWTHICLEHVGVTDSEPVICTWGFVVWHSFSLRNWTEFGAISSLRRANNCESIIKDQSVLWPTCLFSFSEAAPLAGWVLLLLLGMAACSQPSDMQNIWEDCTMLHWQSRLEKTWIHRSQQCVEKSSNHLILLALSKPSARVHDIWKRIEFEIDLCCGKPDP